MTPLWKVTFFAIGFWGIGHAAVHAQSDCSSITWPELKGDVDPSQHPGFAPVPDHLTYKQGIYLRTEALEALKAMAAAARVDGINLLLGPFFKVSFIVLEGVGGGGGLWPVPKRMLCLPTGSASGCCGRSDIAKSCASEEFKIASGRSGTSSPPLS